MVPLSLSCPLSCAARFGGLTPLLAKFPDIFELSNDPPFNHISIASSFNAADADLVTHSINPSNHPKP